MRYALSIAHCPAPRAAPRRALRSAAAVTAAASRCHHSLRCTAPHRLRRHPARRRFAIKALGTRPAELLVNVYRHTAFWLLFFVYGCYAAGLRLMWAA